MPKIIKVRCNGPNKHVNEIDLDKLDQKTVVLRGSPATQQKYVPDRLILPCRFCTEGNVIVTRVMIEENL